MIDDLKPTSPDGADAPSHRPPTRWESFLGRSGVAVALYLQIGMLVMTVDAFSYPGGRPARPTMVAMCLLTSALVGGAFAPRLREKGYLWPWSLFGFLSLAGWVVVSSLPERKPPQGILV
jgi:hypothetical protein